MSRIFFGIEQQQQQKKNTKNSMDWFAIAFGADYNALSEIVAGTKWGEQQQK